MARTAVGLSARYGRLAGINAGVIGEGRAARNGGT